MNDFNNSVSTDAFWHRKSTRIAELLLGLLFLIRCLYFFFATIIQTIFGTVSILDSILNFIIILIFIVISFGPIYIGSVLIKSSINSKSPIDIIIIHKNTIFRAADVQKDKILLLALILLTSLVLLSSVIKQLGPLAINSNASNLSNISSSGFNLKRDVDFGDILTPFAIGISAAMFLYGWYRDQQQKRKEYADTIRSAASMTIAKLERWRELFLCFFDDISPLIIETDIILSHKQDFAKSRDYFVKGFMKRHARMSQRIMDEQIEIAYKDLGGYDEDLENRCYDVLKRLKSTSDLIYEFLFYEIQRNLEDFGEPTHDKSVQYERTEKPISSSEGISKSKPKRNRKAIKQTTCAYILKNIVNMCKIESDDIISEEIESFHEDINALLGAKDNQVAGNKIKISPKHVPETHLINAVQGLTHRYKGAHEKSRYSFEMSLSTYERGISDNEKAKEHRKKAEDHYENAKEKFENSVKYYREAITGTNASPGLHAGKGLSQKALAGLLRREADYRTETNFDKPDDPQSWHDLYQNAQSLEKEAEKEIEDALSGYMEKYIIEKVSYINEKKREEKR